jgi:hypothetical protein
MQFDRFDHWSNAVIAPHAAAPARRANGFAAGDRWSDSVANAKGPLVKRGSAARRRQARLEVRQQEMLDHPDRWSNAV